MLPSEKQMQREEVIEQVCQLKEKGWMEIIQSGKNTDGAIGNSVESYLNLRENNIPIADLGRFELKTHRGNSNSLITLFHKEPGPKRADAIFPILVSRFGWPINHKYPPNEKSLRVDMDAAGYSERGFKIGINEVHERLDVVFDSNMVKPEYQTWRDNIIAEHPDPIPDNCYWPYEPLKETKISKMRNMIFLRVKQKHQDNKKYKKIESAILLERCSFDKFLECLRKGHLQIEFNGRTHHNHGVAFRTWERYLPNLFDDYTIID